MLFCKPIIYGSIFHAKFKASSSGHLLQSISIFTENQEAECTVLCGIHHWIAHTELLSKLRGYLGGVQELWHVYVGISQAHISLL